MGRVIGFYPEKLVLAVLISEPELKQKLLDELTDSFGSQDYISQEIEFSFTRYYCEEMGDRISRFFLSFQDLVNPERLAEIKIETNYLESHFSREGKRKVNLDPGLLSLSRFILATTKDSSHRIPLHSGIYAETTLIYERKEFRAVEWTYPDYRSPEYLKILHNIRSIYKKQSKS
ncbi:hypothetical protein ES703_47236 [subsurface metagenome]